MDYFTEQIQDEFSGLSWDQVYDFIEFLYPELNIYEKASFEAGINQVFSEEGVQYKFVNGQIINLMSSEEVNEISKLQAKDSTSSTHINKAVQLFNQRPTPDYANCIKESISAVEAIAREIAGDPSATLGDAVKKIGLHPSLEQGISKIYGWTSDESGIRHAAKALGTAPGEAEARFALVTCSAITNFLSEKQ